jgi:tetratricopeptide (TPR) repeat protein
MRQEQVFCEKCGKERLLVPVFEPEIEDSVAESMSNIVQELSPDENRTEDAPMTDASHPKQQERKKNEKTGFRQVSFFVTALVALMIFISVFSILFYVYTENSYDYQYQKAEEAYQNGQWEEALEIADRCLELDDTSIDVRLLKIKIYQQQGLTDTVIEKTLSLLKKDPANQEAYEILLPIYIEREKYQAISDLLAECPVQAVTDKYADYLALPPEFGTEEGTFSTSISLKLIAGGTGNIYYTLDDSKPGKYSDRYTSPIKLISGTYRVSAVYVNNYGVSSEVVTKTYQIDSDVQMIPDISADSGSYEIPVIISVSVPDQEDAVYYTTDGSNPTMDSNIYTTPFTMPLGHSEYRFLMVDGDGNESEIITRTYDCNPIVNYTQEQACLILKQNLIAKGEILDVNGTMAGTDDKKEYVCDSVVASEDVVYYMIFEYIRSTSGTMIRSGNAYAFSVLDGQIRRATVSVSGYLSLSEF